MNLTDPTGMCPIEVPVCEEMMYAGARDTASTMTLGQGAIVMGILVAPTAAVMAPAAGAAILGNPVATAQAVAAAGEMIAPGAGLVAGGAAVASKVITSEGALRTSATVADQLAGSRSYIPTQAIQEAIAGGARVADPQGVPGQFMYRAGAEMTARNSRGEYTVSRGTLEVLVDENTNTVNHVLYRSSPP